MSLSFLCHLNDSNRSMDLPTAITSIQHSNNRRHLEQSGGQLGEDGAGSFTFPAPATELLAHGAASTQGYPGLWAYVAETAIVVVKSVADVTRNWPLFVMLDASGWDTYCSVSFCQTEPGKWPVEDSPLVGATQGGLVRIFNIENYATVKFHDCHLGHKTIAQWSPRNARLIYGIDDLGQMSVWDIADNSCVLLSFGNLDTVCMAVSPVEDDIVALGDKDGTVRIVNTVGTGSILHTISVYNEIYSVTWKPFGAWDTVPKLRRHPEPYLAISCTSFKHPAVYIYDREGKDVAVLSSEIDTASTTQQKLMMRSVPSFWVPKLPTTTNQLSLVSIGPCGEILTWTEHDTKPVVLHELNCRRNVFGLILSGDILWSFTVEPYIVGWNLWTNKVEAIIPTYTGICSISYSGIENTRVAIGGVDSYIRVLKIDDEYPNGKEPELPLLPCKLQGKITAVAFHPWMDKVGFGTDGGMLGVYEFKAENRFVMEFIKRVGGTVYTVDWGPKCYTADCVAKFNQNSDGKGKTAPNLWLYACGKRNIFAIHPGRRDNALICIGRIIGATNGRQEDRIASGITDMKWSPDHIYLAVGYSDGKIEIYLAPNLNIRCWIKCHSTAIQFLSWRGLDFSDSESKHKYLASAANDGTAKVYDVAGLFDVDFLCNPDADTLEFISSKAILNGHRGIRVIQVVWSPHDNNHVLTVSYDTTAVIWDLRDNSKIARYMGHEHRLVACGFHPTNPYMIFTCSDEMMTNSCFHMWDYRKHPEVEDYQEKMAQKSMIGSTVECVKALAAPKPKLMFRPGQEDAAVGKDKFEKRPVRQDANARLMSKIRDRMTLLPLLTHCKPKNTLLAELEFLIDGKPLPNPEELTDADKEMILAEASTTKKLNKVDLLVDEMELKAVKGELDNLDPYYHLKLFGSAADAEKIVETEFEGHVKRGDFYSAVCLLGWAKDPHPFIQRLMAAGHMKETLVHFAKKCSKRFYLEVSRAYAEHLAAIGKTSEAAWQYWHVLESFDEAYQTLIDGGLLLEALIFSKHNRLGDGKEEDKVVLDKLAAQMEAQNVAASIIADFYAAIGVEQAGSVQGEAGDLQVS